MSAGVSIKKEYKLGPGGIVGRGGAIYRPGDSIWLTDEEYEASNKARLTLVNAEGRVVRDGGGATVVTTPTTATVPSAALAASAAPTSSTSSTPSPDYDDFVANATAESLITYIQDATVDQIKALRDAEKGRGKSARPKVVSAANAALRRINMAKARAVRDAKQAERESVARAAENKGAEQAV